MNEKVWFYLEAMILLEGGMKQFEVMAKGIPARYITLAKETLNKILE